MADVRMINTNPDSRNYNKVQFFTEQTANSSVLKRDGWERQELKEPEKPKSERQKLAEAGIEKSADVSEIAEDIVKSTEKIKAEEKAEPKPKGKPGRKATKK